MGKRKVLRRKISKKLKYEAKRNNSEGKQNKPNIKQNNPKIKQKMEDVDTSLLLQASHFEVYLVGSEGGSESFSRSDQSIQIKKNSMEGKNCSVFPIASKVMKMAALG
jgi:hypothetical protein